MNRCFSKVTASPLIVGGKILQLAFLEPPIPPRASNCKFESKHLSQLAALDVCRQNGPVLTSYGVPNRGHWK